MKTMKLGGCGPAASQIALGCMRMHALSASDAARVLDTAHAQGINFFDHADIYGGGQSETVFAAAFAQSGLRRQDVFLQSKCGIRVEGGVRYDFSKEHILASVEGILSRLGTEYLDVLVLHRPDALMEPEEVADAFDELNTAGKVRFFGVSNHNPMQAALLQKYISHKLIVNQLQFSPAHTGMIDCAISTNMKNEGAVQRDGMVLDYCRLNDVTIQAWSPLQTRGTEGFVLEEEGYAPLVKALRELGAAYGISETAAILAWILRHPARIQPIIGSMNPEHITDLCKAADIHITREEWYAVYAAGGNEIP